MVGVWLAVCTRVVLGLGWAGCPLMFYTRFLSELHRGVTVAQQRTKTTHTEDGQPLHTCTISAMQRCRAHWHGAKLCGGQAVSDVFLMLCVLLVLPVLLASPCLLQVLWVHHAVAAVPAAALPPAAGATTWQLPAAADACVPPTAAAIPTLQGMGRGCCQRQCCVCFAPISLCGPVWLCSVWHCLDVAHPVLDLGPCGRRQKLLSSLVLCTHCPPALACLCLSCRCCWLTGTAVWRRSRMLWCGASYTAWAAPL